MDGYRSGHKRVAMPKTIDYRFCERNRPKQGVCRAECTEAKADNYATVEGVALTRNPSSQPI